jgi:Domain of unknown function (DUF4169)
MADPINLNRFRKAKRRVEDARRAAENRVAFGRTRADHDKAKSAADKASRDLDGKKLD